MDGPPRTSLSESEIVDRIRAGETGAEEELVRHYSPGLHAIAMVRAGREAADDLVQETLSAAIANLRRGDWRGEGKLGAYLASIVRNLAYRRRARLPSEAESISVEELPDPGGDPLAALEEHESRIRVRRALMRLPDAHREVLLRHYFRDQNAGEIAREMGTPRGTVLSRLHYARRELQRLMNQERPPRH